MVDTRETTLGALIKDGIASLQTGPFGTALKAAQYSASGVPLISVGEIRNGHIEVTPKTPRVDPQVIARLPQFVLRTDDIVFARKGAVDRTARIVPHQDGWFLGSDGIRLRLQRSVESAFVAYVLRSQETRSWILQNCGGAIMPSLNHETLSRIPLRLPSISIQRSIARTLGALDDKIELNRRMCETLEAIARALFRSWFVEFDPILATVDCLPSGERVPGLYLRALTSTSAGLVPEGWISRPLAGWATALSGGTPSKSASALWGGELPWISPKVMTEIHADHTDSFVTPAAIGNGTRLAPSGSTLVMVRGMGLHERVRISQARCDVTFNQDVKALVPKDIEPTLLLFAMLDAQADLLGRVESAGHGTGKLASEVLLAHPIAMPSPQVQRVLAKPLNDINDRIGMARREMRTIAALRDVLLPKLLSGELSIRQAERAAGS